MCHGAHDFTPVTMFVGAVGVDHQHVARPGDLEGTMQPEVVARRRMDGQGRAGKAHALAHRFDGRRQRADLAGGFVQGCGRQLAGGSNDCGGNAFKIQTRGAGRVVFGVEGVGHGGLYALRVWSS
jgi:hypothetical protein